MSFALDDPVSVRGVTVAALSRVTLVPVKGVQGVSVLAEKHPVALLLRDADGVRFFSPDGCTLSAEVVESLKPGVCALFDQITAKPVQR